MSASLAAQRFDRVDRVRRARLDRPRCGSARMPRCRRSPARPSRRDARPASPRSAGLCGGSPAGTNRIRSRPRASRASSAIARCPMWMGSNVPPMTPMAAAAHRRGPPAAAPVTGARSRARPPTRARPPRPEPCRRAGCPARRSSASAPEALEVALEPLGRLLDLEVGLGRDPLDPPAERPGTPPSDSSRTVDPIRRGVEPVDDDARRLRRRAELLGGRQQLGDRGAERLDALARRRRDRHRVAAPRARGPPGTPATPRPPTAGRSC